MTAVVEFPVVGIGSSAGGLAAFEAFFSGLPRDAAPGMAFVLVQHLAPDHKSLLAELIRRVTTLEVLEIEDGMRIEIDRVYVIPPNHDLALVDGVLHLLEPSAPRGQRLPIDFFFRSLAQDRRDQAFGIVLAGTGSDGTQGVRAIKGEGGLVIVQSPASAEFDGMPRSALATGLADYELSPAEMPAQLMAYAARAIGRLETGSATTPGIERALKEIFVLLHHQTRHDFSGYKPTTIHRRIERRMAVHHLDSIDAYVHLLHRMPDEVELLFGDLLIGVTQFFRDPHVFQLVEEHIIPRLFASRPAGETLRVWTAACSTGEEAYSLVMLLIEYAEANHLSHAWQVFATDIDRRAIATARVGCYPASIATDVTPARLARFFTFEPGRGYRVNKTLRDHVVFSEHDLLKDPPFSRIDLLSCRNLFI
ncbi:MAG: hypothetical protein NT062_00385 [Proteobacteria bacterium]|nr:hypothetical protein [Pseudomonadota bacterium]